MKIYTDGSANPNPGPGGFAVIVLDNNENLLTYHVEREKYTTNNRMELSAILWAFLKYGVPENLDFMQPTIYSDSAYCINTFTNWMFSWANNNWIKSDKKKPENLDLIQIFYKYWQKGYRINFEKVKGHSGNHWNELVDKLAKREVKIL